MTFEIGVFLPWRPPGPCWPVEGSGALHMRKRPPLFLGIFHWAPEVSRPPEKLLRVSDQEDEGP